MSPGLLVVSSRRRAELPLAVGVGRPELALQLTAGFVRFSEATWSTLTERVKSAPWEVLNSGHIARFTQIWAV